MSGKKKKRSFLSGFFGGIGNLLGLVLTAAALLAAAAALPAQRPAETTASGSSALGYKIAMRSADTLSDAMDGYIHVKKNYKIPAGALPAVPRAECFGATRDPQEILAVIDSVPELMDGQSIIAWTPETQTYLDDPVTYYCDETILVLCWRENWRGRITTFLEVKLADASQLRRKLAGDTYGYAMQFTASELAIQDHAVAAMNGDFYGFRTNGVRVYQGKTYLYNGEDSDLAFFTREGDMLLVRRGTLTTKEQIDAFVAENDIEFSLAFGPILAENGEKTIPGFYPRGELEGFHSRSVISQLGKLHYLCAVITGEGTPHYPNADQSATIMLEHGCKDVYNLDGGQTAVIYMGGRVRNRVDYDHERNMTDVLCFASALPEGGEP